jgi:hypothetical protein
MRVSSFVRLFALLTAATWLGLPGRLASQDQPASDLKADGKAYVHGPSRSRYVPLEDWEVLPPQTVRGSSFLTLRQPEAENEVTISWTALGVPMEEALKLEVALLTMLYGQDKVGKPEPIMAKGKAGSKITVDGGPTRDGREAGVVYLFETGPDDKNRWKVKVRGTVLRVKQAEGVAAVEKLLEGFEW